MLTWALGLRPRAWPAEVPTDQETQSSPNLLMWAEWVTGLSNIPPFVNKPNDVTWIWETWETGVGPTCQQQHSPYCWEHAGLVSWVPRLPQFLLRLLGELQLCVLFPGAACCAVTPGTRSVASSHGEQRGLHSFLPIHLEAQALGTATRKIWFLHRGSGCCVGPAAGQHVATPIHSLSPSFGGQRALHKYQMGGRCSGSDFRLPQLLREG